jgi:hypothetical protein
MTDGGGGIPGSCRFLVIRRRILCCRVRFSISTFENPAISITGFNFVPAFESRKMLAALASRSSMVMKYARALFWGSEQGQGAAGASTTGFTTAYEKRHGKTIFLPCHLLLSDIRTRSILIILNSVQLPLLPLYSMQ